MIEHQLEALQSEAWGVSGEEHTLDFARRVRELLEAQEFETGNGSLEDLPDIVRHICGHAEAIERRRAERLYGLPPWQEMMRKYLHEKSIKKTFDKYKYATDYAINDIIKAGNKEEDKSFGWELSPPLTNRFIAIAPDTSGSVSPENIAEFVEGAKDIFGPPGNPEEGEPTRSEIIREEFERRGIPVIDIKMSERETRPEDWVGIPIIKKDEEKVEWHMPEGIEEMGHHRKMVFLDEFDPINRERDDGEQSE